MFQKKGIWSGLILIHRQAMNKKVVARQYVFLKKNIIRKLVLPYSALLLAMLKGILLK